MLGRFHECVSRIRLNAPTIPYVSTLTGNWADARELTDPGYWVSHLREPVRFAGGLQQLLDQPGTVLLEAGPGQGLCALARHNSGGRPRAVLASTCKAQEPGGDLAQMLAAAGGLWTRGCAIDWATARGSVTARRVSVPTYAFDHQRHWIEPGLQLATQAQPRPASGPQPRPALSRLPSRDDWFRVPEWRRSPLAQPASPGGRWLVLGNGSTLTADVAAQAAAEGATVTLVRRGAQFARLADGSFTLDAADPADFSRVLAALEQEGRLPDHIVHLWALDTVPVAPRGQVAGQALAFDSLLALCRALQEADVREPLRLTVVTAGSQAVDGEAVPHPERALALGPCRVIPHEMPNVRARLVDLDSFDISSVEMSRAIVREAAHPDDCDLVAYRGGERCISRLVRAQPPPRTRSPASAKAASTSSPADWATSRSNWPVTWPPGRRGWPW